jgi:heptosyltransferase-2
LNWLGDSIMTMPAIQAYARAFPEKRLTMLVKPALAELWPMHPAIDETLVCAGALPEIRRFSAQIRDRHFASAFILPQSFRSALIPFLGKIPQRIGLRGHFRGWLLTKTTHLPQNAGNIHQQYEYMAILGQATIQDELPLLRMNAPQLAKAGAILGHDHPWIGLMPGAARGAAKRWPADYFAALGQTLKKSLKCNLVLFGSSADTELCARIAASIGNVINLAGKTSLPELAAFMSLCSVVIGNDSGGVHLAAAAGAAVIVIFGMTDPAKTKPLGRRVVVLQDSPFSARDIPRHSAAAEKSLKNISPEMAAEAVRNLI